MALTTNGPDCELCKLRSIRATKAGGPGWGGCSTMGDQSLDQRSLPRTVGC